MKIFILAKIFHPSQNNPEGVQDMKKALSIILATLIAFAFVSCSNPTTDTPATNGESDVTNPDTTDKTDDPATDDPTTDPVVTPDAVTYLYSATAGATTDISYVIDLWSTGTTLTDVTTDATYATTMNLASGTGWGDPAACIAFTKFPAGTLSLYKNIVFKIKTTDYTSISVKVPDTPKDYALSTGTVLAGGWVQMTVPLSDFGNFPASSTEFAIFNNTKKAAGAFLITDIGLSGTAATVNKAGLTAALSAANTLLAEHVAGSADGNVPQAAYDTYSAAITAAKAVFDNSSATQPQVVAAVSALTTATTTFKAAIIVLSPSDLAAVPTAAAADVISLYNSSVTYTDITGVTWNPNWGQSSTISDFTVGSTGKKVKKLDLKNYQGVDFSGNVQALDTKVILHFSYWTMSSSKFSIYAVSTADGTQVLTSTMTGDGAWHEMDVTLSPADANQVKQLKFTAANTVGGAETAAPAIIFLDNVYFH
jgi:hypothetical protein